MKRVRFEDDYNEGVDGENGSGGDMNTSYCNIMKWNSVGCDNDESDSSTASFSSDDSSLLFHNVVGTFEMLQDSDDDDGDQTTLVCPINHLTTTSIVHTAQMDDDSQSSNLPQNLRKQSISNGPKNKNHVEISMEPSSDVVKQSATTLDKQGTSSVDLKESESIIASNKCGCKDDDDGNSSRLKDPSISISHDTSLPQKEAKTSNLNSSQPSFDGMWLVEINNNNNSSNETKEGQSSFKDVPDRPKIMTDKAAGREEDQQEQKKEKETKDAITNKTNQELIFTKPNECELNQNEPPNISTMLMEISTISTLCNTSSTDSSIGSFDHSLTSLSSSTCDLLLRNSDNPKIRFLKQKLRLLAETNTPDFFKQYHYPNLPQKKLSRDLHYHEHNRVTLKNSHMNPKIFVLKQKLRLLKEKNDFSKNQKLSTECSEMEISLRQNRLKNSSTQ